MNQPIQNQDTRVLRKLGAIGSLVAVPFCLLLVFLNWPALFADGFGGGSLRLLIRRWWFDEPIPSTSRILTTLILGAIALFFLARLIFKTVNTAKRARVAFGASYDSDDQTSATLDMITNANSALRWCLLLFFAQFVLQGFPAEPVTIPIAGFLIVVQQLFSVLQARLQKETPLRCILYVARRMAVLIVLGFLMILCRNGRFLELLDRFSELQRVISEHPDSVRGALNFKIFASEILPDFLHVILLIGSTVLYFSLWKNEAPSHKIWRRTLITGGALFVLFPILSGYAMTWRTLPPYFSLIAQHLEFLLIPAILAGIVWVPSPKKEAPKAEDKDVYSLGWYGFLKLALLPVAAIGLVSAILLLSGNRYGEYAEFVYGNFPQLRTADAITAILCIALCALPILTWLALFRRQPIAPKLLTLLHATGIALLILYPLVTFFLIGNGEPTVIYGEPLRFGDPPPVLFNLRAEIFGVPHMLFIVLNALMIRINQRYFDTRAYLFVK